jgi:hypothetical protein
MLPVDLASTLCLTAVTVTSPLVCGKYIAFLLAHVASTLHLSCYLLQVHYT